MTDYMLLLAASVAASTVVSGLFGAVMLRRQTRALARIEAAVQAGDNRVALRAVEGRLLQAIAEHRETAAQAMDEALDQITRMKADLEWLAGDKMIEQAITLAQSGADSATITAETGLSTDDAELLRRFRPH